MEIFIELLILLAAARICGELAERAGQSAPVGELLAGVLLAAFIALDGVALPLLDQLGEGHTIHVLAELGIFFLILQAGVEMKPREIREASLEGFFVALGGMLLPLAVGFGLGLWLLPEGGMLQAQALVLGVAMSITAIPATVRVLEELDLLHSRVGRVIVTASLFDDVMGMILLAVLTAVIEMGRIPDAESLLWLLVRVAIFFLVTGLLGAHVYPQVSRRMKEMRAAALELSALIGAALLYGVMAEALGIHWILGAFMAGLYFEESRVGKAIYRDMTLVLELATRGLVGPIFFLSIGFRVDLGAFLAVPLFILLLTAAGFLTKLLGAGLPALLLGFGARNSALVGAGMTARGAVELVILGIVAEAGVFPDDGNGGYAPYLFSALVVMAMLNTLAAPIALKRLAQGKGAERDG